MATPPFLQAMEEQATNEHQRGKKRKRTQNTRKSTKNTEDKRSYQALRKEIIEYIKCDKPAQLGAFLYTLTPKQLKHLLTSKSRSNDDHTIFYHAINNTHPIPLAMLFHLAACHAIQKPDDINGLAAKLRLAIDTDTSLTNRDKLRAYDALDHIQNTIVPNYGQNTIPQAIDRLAPYSVEAQLAKQLLDQARTNKVSDDTLDTLGKFTSDEKKTAILDAHDYVGGSPLFYAIAYRNLDLVTHLLKLGADSRATSPIIGYPLVTYALMVLTNIQSDDQTKDIRSIVDQIFLSAFDSKWTKDEFLKLITTMLDYAAMTKLETTSNYLTNKALNFAAEAPKISDTFFSPEELDIIQRLHTAAIHGYNQVIYATLASPWYEECDPLVQEAIIDSQDDQQRTLLHHAAHHKNARLFNFLIAKGAKNEGKTLIDYMLDRPQSSTSQTTQAQAMAQLVQGSTRSLTTFIS
jgi:ankyrin repeat protein